MQIVITIIIVIVLFVLYKILQAVYEYKKEEREYVNKKLVEHHKQKLEEMRNEKK